MKRGRIELLKLSRFFPSDCVWLKFKAIFAPYEDVLKLLYEAEEKQQRRYLNDYEQEEFAGNLR